MMGIDVLCFSERMHYGCSELHFSKIMYPLALNRLRDYVDEHLSLALLDVQFYEFIFKSTNKSALQIPVNFWVLDILTEELKYDDIGLLTNSLITDMTILFSGKTEVDGDN